jgi:hypothetical protein
MGSIGSGALAAITGAIVTPTGWAAPFHIRIKGRRLPHEFTLRQVGIANPCVFDKPLMPHPAVWTVGAAEKYRGAAE